MLLWLITQIHLKVLLLSLKFLSIPGTKTNSSIERGAPDYCEEVGSPCCRQLKPQSTEVNNNMFREKILWLLWSSEAHFIAYICNRFASVTELTYSALTISFICFWMLPEIHLKYTVTHLMLEDTNRSELSPVLQMFTDQSRTQSLEQDKKSRRSNSVQLRTTQN